MYNWNTDTTQLKKNKKKYTIWKLEQQINYGLGINGKKINRKDLKKYFNELNIDQDLRAYLTKFINK